VYTFHLKGTRRYRDSAPVFRCEEHQHTVTQGWASQSHQDVGLHNNTMDGLTHRIAIPRLENLWKDSLFSARKIDNVLNMRERSHLLF
jgi:hypothetical protein